MRPTADLVGLADALIEEAGRRGAGLRLLGGVAIWLSSPRGREVENLRRGYKDIDFAAVREGSRGLPAAFAACGWEADARFNALHGKTRLLFFHGGDLQADVFLGSFEQCHRLVITSRTLRQSRTLPPAELLLTKLQVREPNEKDIQDALALLLDHDFGERGSEEAAELEVVRSVAGSDWGWYATCIDSIAVLRRGAERLLTDPNLEVAMARLAWLEEAIESAPKSTRWRLRSIVGRRWPWYEEPEEVNR